MVKPAAGPPPRDQRLHGVHHVEEVGFAALAGADFKFSTDPLLEAKIRDAVGLCLNPPDKAIVLCIDEKSQVQALDLRRQCCGYDSVSRRSRRTTTCGTASQPCSRRWRLPRAW